VDPFTFCLLLAAVVMKMTGDLAVNRQRVKDGKDPVGLAMFNRALERRGGKPRKGGSTTPKRPGMRGYLKERWLDAWDDAIAQHKEHRAQQQKDRIRERETGVTAPKRPSLWQRLQGWRRTPADQVYVPDPGPSGPTCEWCSKLTPADQLDTVHRYGTAWQMCPTCQAADPADPADDDDDPDQDTNPDDDPDDTVHDPQPAGDPHICPTVCPHCGGAGSCDEVPGGPINGQVRHVFWHHTTGARCNTDPEPVNCGVCPFQVDPLPQFWDAQHGYYRHPACVTPDENHPEPRQAGTRCDICDLPINGRWVRGHIHNRPIDKAHPHCVLGDADTCTVCRQPLNGNVDITTAGPRHSACREPLADSGGRHRATDGSASSATGDVTDVNSCDAECAALLNDLARIDAATDTIDTAVRNAAAAAEHMAAFLTSKNVPQVAGLDTVVDVLGPEEIRQLIDTIAAARDGVRITQEGLVPLREAEQKLAGADGSALNGR